MERKNLITLLDLSKKIGCNKSKLLYYYNIGAITPVIIVGKTAVFDELEVMPIIKYINKRVNEHGISLKKIVEEINDKKNRGKKSNKISRKSTRHST